MRLQVSLNFAPKSGEKEKQLPSVAIFSQPNSNEDQKTKKTTRSSAQFVRLLFA